MARVARDLRNSNRISVVEALLERREPISRAQIGKRTGMSGPTVMRIVDELTKKNIVEECDPIESGLGRKPVGLRLKKDGIVAATVLYEGKYLQAGILDLWGCPMRVAHMQVEGDLRSVLTKKAIRLIADMLDELGIPAYHLAGLGIALPACVDPYTNTIFAAPLIGVNEPTHINSWVEHITQTLGVPVRLENDVNALALGEHADRELGEKIDMGYIAMGTGIGCGLMLRGALRRGRRNKAGEIGYLRVPREEAKAGSTDELERRIGLSALEAFMGIDLSGSVTKAQRSELIDYIVPILAPAVANLSVCVDIELIVLGGYTFTLLGEELVSRLSDAVCPLVPFSLKIESGVSKTPGLTGMGVLIRDLYLKRLARDGLDIIL